MMNSSNAKFEIIILMNSSIEESNKARSMDEKIKLLSFWCHACKFEFQTKERKDEILTCKKKYPLKTNQASDVHMIYVRK